MVVVLLASLGVRLLILNSFQFGRDQAGHILIARMLALGYEPYSELFVSYPPLFVWSLEWPWRLWGAIEPLKFVMTGYALLGIAAAGLIGYRLNGWLAGCIAAVALSFSREYLAGSCIVSTGTASVSVGVLSVALALIYYSTGKRLPLVASGVCMAASLMLKILSPFLLALIPLMILVRHVERRPGLRMLLSHGLSDGALWVSGLLGPIVISLLLFDAHAMYDQVIAFRFDTRAPVGTGLADSLALLSTFFLSESLMVTLSAAIGVVFVLTERKRGTWIALAWLGLALLFAAIHTPLREKHLPMLVPPLAILAGIGLVSGWYRVTHLKKEDRSISTYLLPVIAAILTFAVVWESVYQYVLYKAEHPRGALHLPSQTALQVQRLTSPSDCIVTDSSKLALFSERLIPPHLSEVSDNRLRSGILSCAELREQTESFGCQIVAPVDELFQRHCPDFTEWAQATYLASFSDGENEVFFLQPLQEARPEHSLNGVFGDEIELVGFDLGYVNEPEHGPELYLSLYWRAIKPITEDYTVFVHVLDPQNNMVINSDHQPYDGSVPTHLFPVGKIVKDTIRIQIPSEVLATDYRVVCGLYSVATLERLPLEGDVSGENAVELGPIEAFQLRQ